MNYYNPETIQSTLDRLKAKREEGGYMKKPDFQKNAPMALNFTPQKSELFRAINDKILSGSQSATALEMVKAQNRYNFKQMQNENQRRTLAQQNFVGADSHSGHQHDEGPIDVSNIPGVNPNARMRTMNFHGINYTVNSSVAHRFQGFLTALWKQGYKPASIGGYANRNIAGTNVKSLHSLGLAIDIDPRKNPVTWNGKNITALPPGVGALAAKYGLAWGGNWRGMKRDTMHFSVPYGGRK